jgi:protein SCO1/2
MRWTCALALLLLAAGVGEAQVSAPAPNAGIDQRLDEKIALDLVFRDEQGRAVALREYFGSKPVILVLAYFRCPRLCSQVLNGLVESLRKIDYQVGKEFTVLTVSIDPRETPELAAARRAAYLEQYGRPGAAEGWHCLTGDEAAIKSLAAAVGYRYFYDAPRDQFVHGSGIMLLTADGTLARYFYGIDYPARDVRFGLEDCAAGKIGSPVARPLRLLCFSYDGATGTYTLMTMRLLRIGGVLTVLALGAFLVRSWRRERRRSSSPLPAGERGRG